MFNLQGSEIIVILLLALVILGPEKLPGAIRRFTKTYAELRKMGNSFQSEVKGAFDEPMREVRETANLIKQQVDVDALEAEQAASEALDESAAAARAEQAGGGTDPDTSGGPPDPATFQPPVAGTARPGLGTPTGPAANGSGGVVSNGDEANRSIPPPPVIPERPSIPAPPPPFSPSPPPGAPSGPGAADAPPGATSGDEASPSVSPAVDERETPS